MPAQKAVTQVGSSARGSLLGELTLLQFALLTSWVWSLILLKGRFLPLALYLTALSLFAFLIRQQTVNNDCVLIQLGKSLEISAEVLITINVYIATY